jgi:hypothetical protein
MNNKLKNMSIIKVENNGSLFAKLISSGGDERLNLNSQNFNKYFINPTDGGSTFNRGSCTSSSLTKLGYYEALSLHEKLNENNFDFYQKKQIEILKNVLNYPGKDAFDIFLAPSGTDLCYYPIIFNLIRNSSKPILNIVTCIEELGSGSLAAYNGAYFSNENQFNDYNIKNRKIINSPEISAFTFNARNKKGLINNTTSKISKLIREKSRDYNLSINIVYGSKSGIENDIGQIANIPSDVLVTVDLCQFRVSKRLINGLIGMNACVMITGSKFYQAPPFCAALLVPKGFNISNSVFPTKLIEPFGNIFSAYDIPSEYPEIKNSFPKFKNYGLLIRWQAALAEIMEYNSIDEEITNNEILNWNKFVVSRLKQSPYLQLMPHQNKTNKSIISFRVFVNNRFLDYDELYEIYQIICTKKYNLPNNFNKILIGQPVKYGDRSFLRVAVGARNILELINSSNKYLLDEFLINQLEEIIIQKYEVNK